MTTRMRSQSEEAQTKIGRELPRDADPGRNVAADKIDEASEHSMDASDPPSYAHGIVGAGRERRSTRARK